MHEVAPLGIPGAPCQGDYKRKMLPGDSLCLNDEQSGTRGEADHMAGDGGVAHCVIGGVGGA